MWYSNFIKTAITAWDVLSSTEISWQGSFEKSIKDSNLSFYSETKMPTMSSLQKFINSITKSNILQKYMSNEKFEVFSDISSFVRNLIRFVDAYLKKGNMDTDLLFILNFKFLFSDTKVLSITEAVFKKTNDLIAKKRISDFVLKSSCNAIK